MIFTNLSTPKSAGRKYTLLLEWGCQDTLQLRSDVLFYFWCLKGNYENIVPFKSTCHLQKWLLLYYCYILKTVYLLILRTFLLIQHRLYHSSHIERISRLSYKSFPFPFSYFIRQKMNYSCILIKYTFAIISHIVATHKEAQVFDVSTNSWSRFSLEKIFPSKVFCSELTVCQPYPLIIIG